MGTYNTLEGDADDNRRYGLTAWNRSSKLAGDPPCGFACRNPQPVGKIGPEKVSVAGLPVIGSDVFGREEDVAFLDRAWANKDVNVVTIYGVYS